MWTSKQMHLPALALRCCVETSCSSASLRTERRDLLKNKKSLLISVCVYRCIMWRSEDNLWEGAGSFLPPDGS